MTEWWLLVFFIGLAAIYLATRNPFSYLLIFYWLSLPGVLVLPTRAGEIFAVGTLARGIGLLAGNALFKFKPQKELADFRKSPMTSLFGSVPTGLIAVGFLVLVIVGIALTYFGTVGIAVLAAEPGEARLLLKGAPGTWLVMRLIRQLMPILLFICYLHWRGRMNLPRAAILAALFLVTTLMLMAVGFKGNILMFLTVPAILLLTLVNPKLPIRWLLLTGAAAVLAAIMVSAAHVHSMDPRVIWDLLWDRLAYQSFDGLIFLTYYTVPVYGYQHGATFWHDFMSLFYKLGLTDEPAQNIGAMVASQMAGQSYMGTQAATYFEGELYFNFGMWGVLLGGAVVGVLLQGLYVFALRLRKDAVLLPFVVLFQVGILMSLGSPFISMVVDNTASIIFFLALLLGVYVFASVPRREVKLRGPTWLSDERQKREPSEGGNKAYERAHAH